jgi:signal transduction histidine kinase/integral membrane sensor domain MASE1/ActR/RegA family two-component response regulator
MGWLICFAVVNLAAAGLTEGLRLIPGVSIVFWPPSGIFVATLLLNERKSWPWWIAGAFVAELTANALWFHNPWPLAMVYCVANAAEALTATLLVRRLVVGASRTIDAKRLEYPRNAALFALLAGAVAPAVGATVIATTDAILGKHEFGTAWFLVWLGDGTGLLFSAPLTLAAVQVWRQRRRVSARQVLEFLVTSSLAVLLAWAALRGELPTVYTTLPVIVWMAVRFQLLGAWVGMAAIILTIAVFTRSGAGEFSRAPDQMRAGIIALQVFLAVCASTALVVGGLSRRHLRALERLRTANQMLERRIDKRTTALRVAGESFRSLVEQSPFGVYAVDADFRLVMVSAGAHKVFQNVRPLLGRDFEEVMRILWPEPFVSDTLQHFRHTLATGDTYHAPSTVEQRLDIGETEAYDWKIDRVSLPDGRPGVVCHFYDLSQRQRYEDALRASEQRYRTLVNATSVVTWSCRPPQDRDNLDQPPWANWLTAATEQLPGNSWVDVVHPEDAESAVAKWHQAVTRCEPFTHEQRIRRQDGQWRWMRVHAAPVRHKDGSVAEWFGMCQDITEVKEAEEMLRESDRRKDEFLATLAHELRNPLAPIRSGLEVMRISADDATIVAEMRDTMASQVSHLVALVDDLLDVSRISQGKLSLRTAPVKLSDVIHDAVALCRPVVDDAGHRLHLEQPSEEVQLHGDFHRLVQIVSNLVSNAAKYTPPGGNIWVRVSIQDGSAVIAVKDDGIGISEHHLHEVFAMFAQIAKPDSMYRGLGIGLSLVKSLVQMHGGSVDVSSAGAGKGATFVVRLPVSDENESYRPVPAERSMELRPGRGHRVLVVDDNYAASRALSLIIQQLGNEVRTAENGSVAVSVARDFRPDLIIMDIGMPVMDGNAAARAIRAEPWGQAMVLVALTGWGQNEDMQETKEAGFDDHLVKPIETDSIRRLLLDLDAHLDAK